MKQKMNLCGRKAEVNFKNIRSVRLRVLPDGMLAISAPVGTKTAYIESFVREHLAWIDAQIAKNGISYDRSVFDGAILRILGEDVVLHIAPSTKDSVIRNGAHLFISAKNVEEAHCEKLLENYLKKEALTLFTQIAQRYYPIFQARGIAMPKLSVRRMTSRWGSCTPKAGTIRFNLYLYEAPIKCVESVVLHEMAHLLYANHGSEFYAFLTHHMPDYHARHHLLEQSVKI